MIWLLRHGTAEEGAPDDASRRLVSKGEAHGRDAGRALAALGVELAGCLTSPKVRALETARLACAELGLEPVEEPRLAGGNFDPEALAGGRDVLLVGHEPDISEAIASVTGARVAMKKGGLAAIEGGELIALLRPDQIRRIAGS